MVVTKDSEKIRSMFADISGRYDLLNHVLSLNVDRSWRRRAAKALEIEPGDRILDVCTGTGDLALEIATRVDPKRGGHVFASDFCAEMVARPKPHPDVYLSAAATLGTDPGRCIAVEDSVAGVTAAAAAGMRVIGFLGGRHIQPGHGVRLRSAGAEIICDSMKELNPTLSVVLTGS